MEITILRLGHRPRRDRRMTTHVALVARAMGAKSIVVCERDVKLERAVQEVNKKFGGEFSVQMETKWKEFVRAWNGPVVHLTMYGKAIESAVKRIPKENILVIVGAEKVPPEVYDLSDFNVAVTNQPHSEVASLAIFLDRVTESAWSHRYYEGGKIIVPRARGKTVIDMNGKYLSDDDCREILREVGCDDELIEHMEGVARIAVKIAELCDADVELVRTASMLHDIGRSVTHGPEHGYEGGAILKGLCFPDSIVSIVERHVGGGLTSRDAKKLGLPERDLLPVTVEEKIVCIADKLIEDNKRSTIDGEIEKLRKKGLKGPADRLLALYNEMEEICSLDLDQIQL